MQISPVNNNNQTFKACYKVPFSEEGYNKLINALKYKGNAGIGVYSKPNGHANDISFFAYSFPYEHLYWKDLTSVLIDNKRVTKEEAEKVGMQLDIFQKLNIFNFALLPPDILNNRLDNLRRNGINVDSIISEQSIYVTTEEDTNVVKEFMTPKVKAHLEKLFGKRKRISELELLEAMNKFYPGPDCSEILPKQNFIQKFIEKCKMLREENLYQGIRESIQNLRKQLVVGNLSREDSERITNEISSLELQLSQRPEPRYVKNARIFMEYYNQEKERFKELFKNAEITPVDSVEELLEIL